MLRTTLASAAFVALAQAVGQAVVVNKCSYTAYMANTPSAGGGYSAIDQSLSPGQSYSQTWTELSNGNGWSIKLSKIEGAYSSDLLQYEYTYHNDGTIWYDLSEVNGNPWDGNWEITASSGCTPRQAAYRYATDDAYGMQSCGSDATITVTLCSGDSDSGSGSASPSPSPTSWAATTPAPSATPEPTTTKHHHHHHGGHNTWAVGDAVLGDAKAKAPAPVEEQSPADTPADSPAPAYNGPAVTVTNVHVETVTNFVTATDAPAKRHEHHARHPHHRR